MLAQKAKKLARNSRTWGNNTLVALPAQNSYQDPCPWKVYEQQFRLGKTGQSELVDSSLIASFASDELSGPYVSELNLRARQEGVEGVEYLDVYQPHTCQREGQAYRCVE